jgi:hypothetical protein
LEIVSKRKRRRRRSVEVQLTKSKKIPKRKARNPQLNRPQSSLTPKSLKNSSDSLAIHVYPLSYP